MAPVLLKSPTELRAWRRSLRPDVRVGFVPTMGALHAGHAELLKRIQPHCDELVLSIFVNPTQFGPNEDLSKYPRPLEADLQVAESCGVDAVFLPTSENMYPPGYSTYVDETALTQRLCGEFRPGHFRGVTTVVLKLFNLVEPHLAYFGLKDAQQFFVLSRMARDLELTVSVEGIPTVREPDGLALSSRNIYLSAEDRAKAPAIHEELQAVSRRVLEGHSVRETLESARAELAARGFRVQYLEALALPDLSPLPGNALGSDAPCLIAVAAYLGTTRLIDNVILRPERLAAHGIRVHAGS